MKLSIRAQEPEAPHSHSACFKMLRADWENGAPARQRLAWVPRPVYDTAALQHFAGLPILW